MSSDFQAHSWHIARKPYVCWATGRPIAKGERYCRMAGKYNDNMYSLPLHRENDFFLDAVDQRPVLAVLPIGARP